MVAAEEVQVTSITEYGTNILLQPQIYTDSRIETGFTGSCWWRQREPSRHARWRLNSQNMLTNKLKVIYYTNLRHQSIHLFDSDQTLDHFLSSSSHNFVRLFTSRLPLLLVHYHFAPTLQQFLIQNFWSCLFGSSTPLCCVSSELWFQPLVRVSWPLSPTHWLTLILRVIQKRVFGQSVFIHSY